MSQQFNKILKVETLPVSDLDSGLPADTYVHSQVNRHGIKQPAFYHRTRYLLNWSTDETLDQPFTLYQGHQEPDKEYIIIDTRMGEDSIKAIYMLGHTVPNPIDTRYVTIVSFTQEASYAVDLQSTQAGLAAPNTVHLTTPTIHTFALYPSPFQSPIPAQPVVVPPTLPVINSNSNLPPKRFPKPTPVHHGLFYVVWQMLGFFHS